MYSKCQALETPLKKNPNNNEKYNIINQIKNLYSYRSIFFGILMNYINLK